MQDVKIIGNGEYSFPGSHTYSDALKFNQAYYSLAARDIAGWNARPMVLRWTREVAR